METTNDMNDEFVEELLAQCVKLQRMGVANHEILTILRQFVRVITKFEQLKQLLTEVDELFEDDERHMAFNKLRDARNLVDELITMLDALPEDKR